MIIGGRINGQTKNIYQTSPLKEVLVSYPNLLLVEAFKILKEQQNDLSVSNNVSGQTPDLKTSQNHTEVSLGESKISSTETISRVGNSNLKTEEQVKMEEAPVENEMDSIAPPSVEELNELRGSLSHITDRLNGIVDELDELQQMAWQTLNKCGTYTKEQTGMKM